MAMPPKIFDTRLAQRRLARAARQPSDFLLTRAAEDIVERLGAVQRRFKTIADIGTPEPVLAEALALAYPEAQVTRLSPLGGATARSSTVNGDIERLPFALASLDLAVSSLALQGRQRPARSLGADPRRAAAGRALHRLARGRPDAPRATRGPHRSRGHAQRWREPRVAPFADVRDMGGLLQRAGFALPVADSETVIVRYPTMFALMADLRAMGATNALVSRSRRPTPRTLFLDAAKLYAARHADADGRVRATFEIVSLSGWAPHSSQAKPARRGSANASLAEALGATQLPSNE